MTFYQNIAVGNIKELDNEALLKSSNESLADKLENFQKGTNNGWVEDLMMELSFTENGKSCFS
jgi:ATP-binding cassette subfamily B protein